jgi:hypothetical protein
MSLCFKGCESLQNLSVSSNTKIGGNVFKGAPFSTEQ